MESVRTAWCMGGGHHIIALDPQIAVLHGFQELQEMKEIFQATGNFAVAISSGNGNEPHRASQLGRKITAW